MSTSIGVQILNFAALVVVGVYFFKRYALPNLTQKIKEQESQKETLLHTQNALKEQQRIIEHEMHFQEQYGLELLVKIGAWRLGVEQEKQRQEHEQQRYYEHMQHYLAQQRTYQQLQLIEQQVLPEAFVQAQELLRKEFAVHKKSQEYVAILVNRLGE